jgi:hypothetical protein
MECTGIVDQNVETTVITPDCFEEGANLPIVTVINPNGNAFTSSRCNRISRLVDGARK